MVKSKRNSRSSTTKLRKNAMVRMRVSAEDKQAFEDAAKRDGLELSAWLRQLALRAAGVLPEPK
jgi:hypothetical protein